MLGPDVSTIHKHDLCSQKYILAKWPRNTHGCVVRDDFIGKKMTIIITPVLEAISQKPFKTWQ